MGYDKRHKDRKAKGLCPNCGLVPEEGYITCANCRKRAIHPYAKSREQAIQHYGGACACCGENKLAFLAIDHNGASRDGDQRNLTQWVIKNNFPEGFRVLCHNCNMATRWGRICPHQQ